MAAPRLVSSPLRERRTRRPITSAMSWIQYGDALIAPPLATISWSGRGVRAEQAGQDHESVGHRFQPGLEELDGRWSRDGRPTITASASFDQPGLRSPATKGRTVSPWPSGGRRAQAASSSAVGGRRSAAFAHANTLPPSLRAPPSSVSPAPTL